MSLKDEIKRRVTKEVIGKAVKASIGPLAIILLVVIVFNVVIALISHHITFRDGSVQEGEKDNVPYLFKEYTEDTEIIGREITSTTNAKEIWDTVIENHGRIKEYLDEPEELKKLMNAEIATSFLDTRENPDAPIDWKKLNSDIKSKEIQGLVKLKRARETGEYITMTYVDPDTFQGYIDAYNASGSDADKDRALNHFTLEKGYTEDSIEGDSVGWPSDLNFDNSNRNPSNGSNGGTSGGNYGSGPMPSLDSFMSLNRSPLVSSSDYTEKITELPFLFQDDYPDIRYGNGTVATSGCGVTCLSMILSYLLDREITVEELVLEKGYNDTSYHLFENAASDYGLSIEQTSDKNAVMEALRNGQPVIAMPNAASGPNAFTDNAHWIALSGITEDGKIVVRDPLKWNYQSDNPFLIDGFKNGFKDLTDIYGPYVIFPKKDIETVAKENGRKNTSKTVTGTEKLASINEIPTTGSSGGSQDLDGELKEEKKGKYYAKIAVWEETTETSATDGNITGEPTTTYKMKTVNVNYEKIVKGYTMPFEFIWAFLLVGQQKEFALELADLVFESTVEISILDSIRINTNVVTNTYTEHVDVETSDVHATVTVVSSTVAANGTNTYSFGPHSDTGSYDVPHTVVNTTETHTNTIDAILSRADVWLLDLEQGFSVQTETTDSSSDTPHDDKVYKPVTDERDPVGIAASYAESKASQYNGPGASVTTSTTQTSTYYRTDVNRNTNVYNKVYTLKNLATPPNVREKTDPDDKEPNFVTIFRKKEYYQNAQNVYSAPRWIFEILEASEKTSDMVDITKYLLYKATDKIYDGVEEMDWDVFWISEYKTLEGSYGTVGGGGARPGRPHVPVTSGIEGEQGQIFDFLLQRGVHSAGVAAILGNLQAKVDSGELTWEEAYAQFEEFWRKLSAENPELKEALLNAKDEESMEYAAWLLAKYLGEIDGSNYELTKDMAKQQIENAQKWLNEYIEKNPYSITGDGSDVLKWCEIVMDEMIRYNTYYSTAGLEYYDIDKTANLSESQGLCCATYVSLVLYKGGFLTAEQLNGNGYQYPDGLGNILSNAGWERLPPSQAQPGDICVCEEHVFIYAGGNEIWDETSGCWYGEGNAYKPTEGTNSEWSAWKNKGTNLRVYRQPSKGVN